MREVEESSKYERSTPQTDCNHFFVVISYARFSLSLSFFLSCLLLVHHQEVSSVHVCDDSSVAAAAAIGAVVGRWG